MVRSSIRRRPLLTAAQRAALELAVRGLTDKEIAAHQGIGVRTVRLHFAHALANVGASNRAQAVALAIGYGLINVRPDDPGD